jgi:hypothetical protein
MKFPFIIAALGVVTVCIANMFHIYRRSKWPGEHIIDIFIYGLFNLYLGLCTVQM